MINTRRGRGWLIGAVLSLLASSSAGGFCQPEAQSILQRSLEATRKDWLQQPDFGDVEHDETTKDGRTVSVTYDVMMIDGSPYNFVTKRDGKPLSEQERARQKEKLQAEVARRAKESPKERAKRLAEYQKNNKRIFDLMRDMTEAFLFSLIGEEKMGDHNCYVLSAAPQPGYHPESRDTQILTGMKGKLWIDQETYQWVRVEAEVTKPVWFGLFIARVYPGTQFLLEQAPVQPGVWLPRHFRVEVKSTILWFLHKNYTHDETYRDYRPAGEPSGRS